jgi:hypothetical protein
MRHETICFKQLSMWLTNSRKNIKFYSRTITCYCLWGGGGYDDVRTLGYISRSGSTVEEQVLCTIGNFPKRTSVRDMHKAFHMPYVYDYITKSCRQQAEVIQNHENENVRYIGQGEARHRKQRPTWRRSCV